MLPVTRQAQGELWCRFLAEMRFLQASGVRRDMISEEDLERILTEVDNYLRKTPHVRWVDMKNIDNGEGWADFIVSVKVEDTYLVESE